MLLYNIFKIHDMFYNVKVYNALDILVYENTKQMFKYKLQLTYTPKH